MGFCRLFLVARFMKHSVRDMSEVDIIRCKDLHHLDFDNLAEVISEAFRTEQEETGFPEDLSSTDFVKNDIIDIVSYGVIARNADTKEVVGYNGLSCLEPTSKSVRAIGPLAVTTKAQGKGTGRKLMLEIIQMAREQGATSIRLAVNAHNNVSFGLYSSLGFQTKEVLSILVPKRPIKEKPEPYQYLNFRRATLQDIPQATKLMESLIGFGRPEEMRFAIEKAAMPDADPCTVPVVAICYHPTIGGGNYEEIVALSLGFHVAAFSFAKTASAWKFMVHSQLSMIFESKERLEDWSCIMIPNIRQPDLFSWLLTDMGFAIQKNMFHLVLGPYSYPLNGVYCHSVEY